MPPLARRTLAALALPVVLVLSACGGSGSDAGGGATTTPSSTGTSAAFPVTVTAGNGEVTIDAEPTKIVSLSPTATEMLWAIGAGDQVVAVDDQSNFPADVPTTDLSGFQPNAEAVAGYSPDLVVASNDANGLLDALGTLDVPTLLLPAATTLEDSFTQIETLGRATGHADEAAAVADEVEQRIDDAVASVPAGVEGRKVYHELDPTFFSVTSETFVGSLYEKFGLTNIADSAADTAGGYPQLSAEFVVKAAPDVIVLADTKCCQQSAETVAQRPAFAGVPAVRNGLVVPMDDDIASRWGPRTADFAESLAKELTKLG